MSQTRAQIRAHPAQQLDLPALSRILSGVQLEEAKLEELRRWGQALRDAGREESVAAGRAILMLIEELERLSLKLRLAGEQLEQVHPVPNSEVDVGAGDPVDSTLHGRLQQVLDRDPDQSLEAKPESVEETGLSAESDSETSSAQQWIETLRRQK